jgi:hypothetical protein
MNSASMATNLLGRAIRLKERPAGCSTDLGSIALVLIDAAGLHFLLLVENKLIRAESTEHFLVLD